MKTPNNTLQTQNISLPSSTSPQQVIAEGIIQNLPNIIDAVKVIYNTHKKGEVFQQVLHSRLEELNINQKNFGELVSSLTELSKSDNADPVTKDIYREMIKALFNIFSTSMKNYQGIDSYLSKL
ncbi:MAG: hypothetical protein BWY08_02118 [Bacteroidetes bacterium ADurb.Bin174]|jgi:hypothetical protein|nr:MAG: hypothetical protein BWY08_02118 [Bacteroidetes bacterium ADurb.Bin174]